MHFKGLMDKDITNYKDILEGLTKEEIIALIDVTPRMVEKCEVERLGGDHLEDHAGPDGKLPCGTHHEIKSQRWVGNYVLRGRGKFSAPSLALYEGKIASNELITIVGYHEATGDIYYRFSFRFAAIAGKYLIAALKRQTNYDTIPLHYSQHESFQVEYIAPDEILDRDSEHFQPKFLNFLRDIRDDQ
jgi:hypothetical protein